MVQEFFVKSLINKNECVSAMINLNEIRIRLDMMADGIVSGLKNRSTFPCNYSVYVKDAVEIIGEKGISFFDLALRDREISHARLGRYAFPDQFPLTCDLPEPKTHINKQISPIKIIHIDNIKDRLLRFYIGSLDLICEKGEDKNKFGQTVDCDVQNILAINERVNSGRFVAEAK